MTDTNEHTGRAETLSTAESPALAPSMPRARTEQPICFVVDDEPGIQNIIAAAASQFGYQIERFRTATKALSAIPTFKPDLLFLDISLEGSDAIDVLRGLAAMGFEGAIQLVSGKDPVTLEEVKRVGERHSLAMRNPLKKPFRLDDVRTAIRDHLAQAPAARSHAPTANLALAKELDRIDLDAMLRKKWLEVWYQPKIDLKQMRFAGAEALVRCRHPEKGLLAPASFLPYADECLMVRLTEIVLLRALADWNTFAQAGFPFKLSVNAPVNVLGKLPIHTIVRDNKPKHQNWPGMMLEVTEDQAMRDIPLLHEVATQLRIHDILLSVDDFGTGYSHLARLKELPFAEVKIDRSLVTNCGENRDNASLCHAAIELAHGFGCTAVGEGIETASELKTLMQMGCDVGQGYLFSKPLPRDQLLSSLVKHARTPA
jgi:EAL domain-containing protein (putative c-di-GMP-specific phosphodiesterase class I)/FixJ family two-component response regulator